jgi:hypothetical protein
LIKTKSYNKIVDQLDRIEKAVLDILGLVKDKKHPIDNKWLTEPEVMKILNLTKREMRNIRRRT